MCPDNYPTGFTQLATQLQGVFGVFPNGTGAGQDDFSHAVADSNGKYTQPCSTTPAPRASGVAGFDRNMPFLNENTLVFGSQTSPNNGNLFNGNEWSTRIDWNAGQNDRIFGEYYWIHTDDEFGAPNASSGIHGFKNPTASHFPNFQASWVHTFSPTLIVPM
jgi:hypothetical protein